MFSNLLTIFLQAQGQSPMPTILMMVGMVVVMYFFMIRPQAKRAKEQKKFGENIAAGERIITTAGIHATISRVNEDGTLKIEVGHGSFMTIERSAVSMEMTSAFRKKTETPVATATK
jgi:preprotein translocase subunit YajC